VRRLLIFAAALVLAASAPSAARGKLVIVTIGSTSLEDLLASDLPSISRLIKQGAVGVMNVRPATVRVEAEDVPVSGYSMEGTCATIGAGTRAAATTDARKAYSASETAEGRPVRELYVSLYGRSPGQAEVLHLGMNRLRFVNLEARYPIEPGALGSALRRAGLRTAAVGNSDTPTELRREAALIAADSNGIIDYGDVSSQMVRRDPTAPYGLCTNANRLLREFRRVLPRADFIVVDVGDTARAASYARHCLEEQGRRLRRRALRQAERIIGEIQKSLNLSQDRILVVSTNPSPQSIEDFDFMPPVVAAGRGIGGGLLTSSSTRRAGIITNTDISASVTEFFGVKPPYTFVGRPIAATEGSAGAVSALNLSIILQVERQPAMRGMASLLVAYVIILSVYALWRRQRSAEWASWAALVPVALFLAVLWQPALADVGLAETVAALAGLVAAVLIAAWAVVRSPSRAFAWICGAIVLTIVADLARGGVLLRDSIMSYTPVDGARYYGIGNEHMGSAIGAALVGAGFLASAITGRRVFRMAMLSVILAAVIAAIGLPSLGANAGGAMAAVAGAVVGLLLWRGRRVEPKHIVIVIAAVLASAGALLVFDSLRSGGAQSHIGRTTHLVAAGGASQIWMIIERKAAMNLMLLRYSPWSKLLIASIAAVLAVLGTRHLHALERLRTDRAVHSGVIGAAVGAFAALVLNDSGVVAAAVAFIYVWTAVLLAANKQ